MKLRQGITSTDLTIGALIRERRLGLGLTQFQFASMIDVTYQQVYKYEAGVNRVSASRLWDIAKALDVPPSHFYDGLYGNVTPQRKGHTPHVRLRLALGRKLLAVDDIDVLRAVDAMLSVMVRSVGAPAVSKVVHPLLLDKMIKYQAGAEAEMFPVEVTAPKSTA